MPGELDGSITGIDARKLEIKSVIQLEGEDMQPMDAVVCPVVVQTCGELPNTAAKLRVDGRLPQADSASQYSMRHA